MRAGNHGFTLVEVCIAVIILAVGILASTRVFQQVIAVSVYEERFFDAQTLLSKSLFQYFALPKQSDETAEDSDLGVSIKRSDELVLLSKTESEETGIDIPMPAFLKTEITVDNSRQTLYKLEMANDLLQEQ